MAAPRWRFVKLGTKFFVAGGVLYLTVSKGIWGDSFKGSMALKDMVYNSDATRLWSETSYVKLWNSGVKSVFGAMATGPSQLGEIGKSSLMSSKDWISEQFK